MILAASRDLRFRWYYYVFQPEPGHGPRVLVIPRRRLYSVTEQAVQLGSLRDTQAWFSNGAALTDSHRNPTPRASTGSRILDGHLKVIVVVDDRLARLVQMLE